MAFAAGYPVPLVTLLKLGRISNLPTVWTNVLAGVVLAGQEWRDWRTGILLLAMSLFYVGGMYLNDFFDRAIDARERPERPIPAGEISPRAVGAIGSSMLVAGIALMGLAGISATLIGVLLAAAIISYDAFHKNNAFAPVMMGLCRALIYCGAAAAFIAEVPQSVIIASLTLLAYVAGLTYAARQESFDRVGNLWPLFVLSAPFLLALPALREGYIAGAIYLLFIGATAGAIFLLARRPMPGAVSLAVGLLIAGISLVDAALLASIGTIGPAAIAVAGFGATLISQKFIDGT